MDAYSQGVLIHKIFAYLFFIPYIWNLLILFKTKTYLNINRKMYSIMPLTVFLLGTSIITGVFLLPMRNFDLDSKIILMICIFSIFLAGEIMRTKRLKRAKISKEGMQAYTRFCKIMYSAFVLIWILFIIYCRAF